MEYGAGREGCAPPGEICGHTTNYETDGETADQTAVECSTGSPRELA